MKKFIVQFLVMISLIYSSSAIPDTLSYWVKGSAIGSYNNTSIIMQWAHFYPEAPCYIKSVTVYFYGNAGTANIYIAGQEAGSSIPEIVGSTNKVLWGMNNVLFDQHSPTIARGKLLPIDPNIYIDGNQFFVGVTSISNGMYLGSDQEEKQLWCESTDGGSYNYQALLVNDGQQAGWQLGANAYLIDVAVDYPTLTPANHFRDITEDYSLPLDLDKGTIASADIDDDGFLDLLVAGKLFKNLEGENFQDITSSSGLTGNPTGNAIIDMDNDGDLDILFIMQGAGTKSKIFINDGTGNFTAKDLNIPVLKSVTCFSIADINNDFLPDLFIGQLWGEYPQPEPNYFLLNDGNQNFTDNTKLFYPDYDGTWNYPNAAWDPPNLIVERNRNSRGSQWVDYDNDGDLDLFVTNYFLQWDEFYRNNGDGSFTDVIASKNIDVNKTGHNHGTGVDWYDYDNDGDMDLLLSQFAHPRFIKDFDHRPLTIYKNNGGTSYNFSDTYNSTDFKSNIGLGYEETYAGAAWGDVNNDGLADFIATTFYGCRFIDFYTQKSDHTFENRSFEYGFEGMVTGEDACWLDFDNDGKLDLAMSNNREFRLFKNYYDLSFDWIEIDLQGEAGKENNIIGARVKITTNNGTFMQEVSVGRGQKMQKPSRLHFGLGKNAEITKIEVRWPGTTNFEEFLGRTPNSITKLIQGQGGEPQKPTAPALVFPDDGATEIDVAVDKLKWQNSVTATKYFVQVSETQDLTKIILENNNLTKTEFEIKTLLGKTKYFWRVSAGNTVGFGDWSEIRNFTTAEVISETPSAPEIIKPDDGESEVSLKNGKFSWKKVDNADSYQLQVSEKLDFSEMKLDLEEITFTEYPVSDLDKNTAYYWQVRAKNKAGYGDWSELRNFITDDSDIDFPVEPTLISPANFSTNIQQNTFLSWQPGQSATKYHLQVGTHFSLGKDLYVDTIITKTSFPVKDLRGDTTFYWQVYSLNNRGESEVPSSTWQFVTGKFITVDVLDVNPTKCFIGNIAPNPVSALSSIEIGINQSIDVDLSVYNLNAVKIATILSKEMTSGLYYINWNPVDVPSGVYYLRLKAGTFGQTKKIVVIK